MRQSFQADDPQLRGRACSVFAAIAGPPASAQTPSWARARSPGGGQGRRWHAHRLRLDERAGGAALLQGVRGRDRHQGELRARLRHGIVLAHLDRIPRPPADLGSGRHHAGEPASRRGAAAVRSGGSQEPDAAGARSQSALVRRLCQLQLARLQHQPRQERGPAEDLRGFPQAQGMGRQDRDRQERHRVAERAV